MLLIPDYDEFNIYTTIDDVEYYVLNLLSQGFEIQDEIYSLCLKHFGEEFKDVIDIFFENED